MDNQFAMQAQSYAAFWEKVLGGLLGWTPKRIAQWSEPLLNGDVELTLHESPGYWVARLLVPLDLAQRLDRNTLSRLISDIELALDGGDRTWRIETAEDMDAAERRVIEVFNRYRFELDRPFGRTVYGLVGFEGVPTLFQRSEALAPGMYMVLLTPQVSADLKERELSAAIH